MTKKIKTDHMTQRAAYRRELWKALRLKFLFPEFTLRCNEKCIHCGGGSFHSWDFDKNEQRVCFKGVLFD